MPCDESCRYANGYFDRIQGAVSDLLERGHMTAEVVQTVAEVHTVCPFELSLDAALWSDLIIGDYNYLLDPVVRLQRFSEDGELALLIDESHQLADRTRSMLSVSIERSDVRAALKESPPAGLARRLKGVDRALLALRRALSGAHAEAHAEVQVAGAEVIEEPSALLRSMQRALDALADGQLDLAAFPITQALMFTLSRWIRSASWVDGGNFCYFGEILDGGRGARNLRISLECLDPSDYLADTLAQYGPHVRFSGTLSPLELYQTQHGQPDAPAERVASAFLPDQQATLIVNDLPVYYRQRESTLPRLADLVADIVAIQQGNYLVALPSFDYLNRLHSALSERHETLNCQIQTPGMTGDERAAFIGAFETTGGSRVGLIVLGGVFGESVDFSHAPLAGVISVGVGLPPVSAVREEMVSHFDQVLGTGGGETVAYRQPAMTKVLQMAGRLLRGPDDRGILCLIDDRFTRTEYQRFFPRHWRPEIVPGRSVRSRLENFWQADVPLPRLRPSIETPTVVSP